MINSAVSSERCYPSLILENPGPPNESRRPSKVKDFTLLGNS